MIWPIPHFWIIDIGESVLEKRAHKNPVSYTHLDVYKRQKQDLGKPLSRRERAKQVVSKAKERAKDQTTKTHRVAVDLGGGAIAQVSTEMLNWGIRSLGDWSGKDSWLKKNSDILQGAPHLMVGLAVRCV